MTQPSIRALLALGTLLLSVWSPASAQFAGDPSPADPRNRFGQATETPAQLLLSAHKHVKNKYSGQPILLPDDEAEAEAEHARSPEVRNADSDFRHHL
jgi:hypothetical protein